MFHFPFDPIEELFLKLDGLLVVRETVVKLMKKSQLACFESSTSSASTSNERGRGTEKRKQVDRNHVHVNTSQVTPSIYSAHHHFPYPVSLQILNNYTNSYHALTKLPYKPNRIPFTFRQYKLRKEEGGGRQEEETYPSAFLAGHVLRFSLVGTGREGKRTYVATSILFNRRMTFSALLCISANPITRLGIIGAFLEPTFHDRTTTRSMILLPATETKRIAAVANDGGNDHVK